MLQITISKRAAFIALVAVLLVIPVAAFAGSVFDDVDDGSTHIDGITYLKDSGVSVGCDANNNFCPDDSVTRAQMGTFMYRLSGNDPATDATVNADTVDGYDANNLVRFAGDRTDNNALVGVDGTAASVGITAPGPGYLVISASSDVFILSGTAFPTCFIEVNGDEVDGSERSTELDDVENREENCSTDAHYAMIAGGEMTIDFEFVDVGVDTTVDETTLNVLFVPFGPIGNEPALIITPVP